MSDLKRCPICGGEAKCNQVRGGLGNLVDGDKVFCINRDCPGGSRFVSRDFWHHLPRRDESAAEVWAYGNFGCCPPNTLATTREDLVDVLGYDSETIERVRIHGATPDPDCQECEETMEGMREEVRAAEVDCANCDQVQTEFLVRRQWQERAERAEKRARELEERVSDSEGKHLTTSPQDRQGSGKGE